jgi:hypothetical protein
MAKIKFKRSSVAGKAPIATDLETGELAINTNDGKLFTKKDDGTILDLSKPVNVKSAVTSLQTGAILSFSKDLTNALYPGGEFTLNQTVVSLGVTATWSTSTTNYKNAYTTYPGTPNTENITLVLTLSGATFNVQSTDTITIGSTTITGTTLTSLGITGTGGTYTISSANFAAAAQTNSSTAVSVNLTTSVIQVSKSATSLTTYTQPLFSQITSNSAVPTFTTATNHNTTNFSYGQGANTSGTTTNYLWIAIPSTGSVFKYVFLGADNFISPSVTGTTILYGITYNIYGFTGFGSSQYVTVVS